MRLAFLIIGVFITTLSFIIYFFNFKLWAFVSGIPGVILVIVSFFLKKENEQEQNFPGTIEDIQYDHGSL